MAIDFMRATIIGGGRTAVGAAAYRSGTELTDDRDERTHDYTKKQNVIHTEIMLPENAPPEYADRAALWNAVEKAAARRDSQLSREIVLALPKELSSAEQTELVRDYTRRNFVSAGMCADIALHDKRDGNPHAHIMLTVRPIDENGEWEQKTEIAYICKNRDGEERIFSAKQFREIGDGWEKQMPYFLNGVRTPQNRLYLTKSEAEGNIAYKDYKRVQGQKQPLRVNRDISDARWDSREAYEAWHDDWIESLNKAREQKGLEPIENAWKRDKDTPDKPEKLPEIHLGAAHGIEKRAAADAAKRGEEPKPVTNKGIINSQIKRHNAVYADAAEVNAVDDVKQDLREMAEVISQNKIAAKKKTPLETNRFERAWRRARDVIKKAVSHLWDIKVTPVERPAAESTAVPEPGTATSSAQHMPRESAERPQSVSKSSEWEFKIDEPERPQKPAERPRERANDNESDLPRETKKSQETPKKSLVGQSYGELAIDELCREYEAAAAMFKKIDRGGFDRGSSIYLYDLGNEVNDLEQRLPEMERREKKLRKLESRLIKTKNTHYEIKTDRDELKRQNFRYEDMGLDATTEKGREKVRKFIGATRAKINQIYKHDREHPDQAAAAEVRAALDAPKDKRPSEQKELNALQAEAQEWKRREQEQAARPKKSKDKGAR